MRTPDEIIDEIDTGLMGQADIDVWSCIWEIIEDILHSVELAEKTHTGMKNTIHTTVRDYVINHYSPGG